LKITKDKKGAEQMSTLDIMLFFALVVVPVSFFGVVMYRAGYSDGKEQSK
jgi:hypothetical protein